MKNRMIYLAGGNSQRFQSNKLLYKYKGKPLYLYTLDTLNELVKENDNFSLLVITQYSEIYENVTSRGIDCVLSNECKKGISYSIKQGILHLDKEDGYDTFIVGDQPFLTKQTLSSFMNKVIQHHTKVGALSYQGELYNPCMFDTSLEKELLALQDDQGGKKVLKRYLDDCCKYEVEDFMELKDIDYPGDIGG